MGVPGYQSWLNGKYKKSGWIDIALQSLPRLVRWLAIDMASIVHEEKNRVRGYPDRSDGEVERAQKKRQREINTRKSEEQITFEVFNAITTKLMALIAAVKPTQGVMFAFDGVAPQGKIQQQRMRRYGAAVGSPSGDSIPSSEMTTDQLPPPTQYDDFDSNAITPGTEFMFRLDQYMRDWIDSNRLNLPPQIIYSSHLTPGEGEHKMVDYIRRGVISTNPTLNQGSIVVHAKDADLIFLLMMTPSPNLVLWREGIGRATNNIFINIDALRYRITALMSPEIPTSESTSQVDYGKIEDYVVLMMFLGNDFLPQHPTLANFGRKYKDSSMAAANSIDVLVDLYRANNRPTLIDGQMVKSELSLTDSGIIIWGNFSIFFQSLLLKEPELLRVEALTDFTYASRMYQDSISVSRVVRTAPTAIMSLDRTRRGRRAAPATTADVKTFQYDTFVRSWYNNALLPLNPSLYALAEHVMGKEQARQYWNISYDLVDIDRDPGLGGPPEVETMVYDYLTSISWVYAYYREGAEGINMDWAYTYYYTPLFGEILRYLDEAIYPADQSAAAVDADEQPLVLDQWKPVPGQKPLTPYEQLLSVLPPSSVNLIPQRLRFLASPQGPSPIYDYFVEKYTIRLDGKNSFDQGIPIIPFVDPNRVRQAVAGVELDQSFVNQYATVPDYIPPPLTQAQEKVRSRNMQQVQAGVCYTSSLGYKTARTNQDRAGQQQRQQARQQRRDRVGGGHGGRGSRGGGGHGGRGSRGGGGRGGRGSSRGGFIPSTFKAPTFQAPPFSAPASAPTFASRPTQPTTFTPTQPTTFTPTQPATFTPTQPATFTPTQPTTFAAAPTQPTTFTTTVNQSTFPSQPSKSAVAGAGGKANITPGAGIRFAF